MNLPMIIIDVYFIYQPEWGNYVQMYERTGTNFDYNRRVFAAYNGEGCYGWGYSTTPEYIRRVSTNAGYST